MVFYFLKKEGEMKKYVLLKVGGEPVAALVNPDEEKIKKIKEMLKAIWSDEKITLKEEQR